MDELPKVKMGRKPSGNSKSAYIRILLYPDEKMAWESQAQRYGLSLSAWMRYILNHAVANPVSITIPETVVKKVVS